MNRFLLFCIAVVAVVGGGFLWWKDAVAPVDTNDPTPVIFVVSRGEGARSVASRLAQEKFVRSPTGFFVLVKFMGIERSLQAGEYRLNRTMDAAKIAETLTHGTLDVWVTTLEGWRVEEIATKLAKELAIPEREFLRVAREGYMFPDTYRIPKDATVSAIVQLFQENFDKKVDVQLRLDAKKTGLSFNDVITLASIVEREGRTDSDRPIIAGILLKRLKENMALETDATIQYELGYQPTEKSWWKKYLTDDDKNVKSPFNTYRNPGLPPHSIANPGLASIKAVIYPKETDYWYYLHDTAGRAHYAKTIEEHTANIAKYLQ
ncbi:endolytic transglycosylase MltG [Candidatus Gottesmanbacteria bacterium]|nr:endolytic transglycosylase MltG [Candidatus Gottesmanbacteria bacterium]